MALTVTERNWLKAVGLVFGGVCVFWILLQFELSAGLTERRERLVYHPVETSMRVVAVPHFLIAILFMTTSRGMRRARSWLWLAATAAIGVGLCLLFARVGGLQARIPKSLFLIYFVVHEFRDEAFFYVVNGDAPKGTDPKRLGWDVLVAPALLLWFGIGVAVVGIAFEIGGLRRLTGPVFGSLAEPARWTIGVFPMVALAIALAWLRRHFDRAHPGKTMGFVRTHLPIFRVFGGILLLILLDLAVNGKVRAIVTLHVTAWYVFVMHQFSQRPAPDPAPRRFSWKWMRTTRTGFVFLHVGIAVLTLIGCAVAAYGFDHARDPAGLWLVVSRDAFPYWTIMHITISFTPKG